MSDAPTPADAWKSYIELRLDRPGWSVARLAREAGIHRSTIFRWKTGGRTGLSVASVRAVAEAFGEDPTDALRAAGQSVEDPTDMEIELVRTHEDLDPESKIRIIALIHERREREREAGLSETRRIIELFKRERGA